MGQLASGYEPQRRGRVCPVVTALRSLGHDRPEGDARGIHSKMTVAREQRSVERFSKSDVNGVVGREIVPQVPDTRQKEVMRISVQGKVCQVGQSRTATVIIDFATRRIPADTCATSTSSK